MSLAQTVFQLEQVDTEVEQREAALRDLQQRRTRHPELDSAIARLKSLTEREAAIARESRSADSELADIEARMKRTHGRLYGGTVVDPRELASLERELEHAGSQRDTVEERCFELMERLDALQTSVRTERKRVADLETTWEREKPVLADEVQRLAASVEALKLQREPLVTSLDPRTRDTYTRLRASLGHAVSTISGGVCSWCHVTIPPKDLQHARGAALVACPNCRRILYAGE
jgi:uncharacterized protein